MKFLRSLVVTAAAVALLSGCTLMGQLSGGDDTTQTGTTGAGDDNGGVGVDSSHTPDPTEDVGPVETIVAPTEEPGAPDRINVQLEMGVPHDIVGKEGEVVGTITVTSVTDNATCTNSIADESKYGKFVIASFEVTAEDSLVDQSDPYYGRNFDLAKIDIIDPYSGRSLPGGLDYDCLPSGDRLSTVQPGRTETGSLAYDVSNELFAIGWFYGHQYFYVPPSVWGAK